MWYERGMRGRMIDVTGYKRPWVDPGLTLGCTNSQETMKITRRFYFNDCLGFGDLVALCLFLTIELS